MRDYNYELLPEIVKRWSPRGFSSQSVPEEYLWQLIDAARFAPSCFNEQPYRYVIFSTPEEVAYAKSHLMKGNQEWNDKVPAYIGILYHKTFQRNGKDNTWAAFDTGTSWGHLSLEAVHLGLVTHAMAGFERVAIREGLGISDEFEFITLVAVGYYANEEELAASNHVDEQPNTREPIDFFVFNRNGKKNNHI
ncbi:MAG: nitroreductase family protein [Clostridiales bacterium]|nr:nitroreductase family protein [Clostridiales bacterium]